MYKALYRKWRPMIFSDVIGQNHVTDTLKRQIAGGRLSHAYLFTGTRGTGKTTCAKLLAKAANCLSPREGEPCNTCASCLGINDGSIIDVIEIDAASNSGVDNIRQIREQTAFAPQEARFRVYIIDECHMLSGGAFNALLKTLEEPPSYVLFVLATTELHKVPATILSRCQRFAFKRISPGDVVTRLALIAKEEGVQLSPDGAELLARMSDGSLRDAISLLDQCLTEDGSEITEESVRKMTGQQDPAAASALFCDLMEKNTAAALSRVSELYMGGKDMTSLLSSLLDICRDLLIFRSTGDRSLLTPGCDDSLLQLDIPFSRLVSAASLLKDALAGARRSASGKLEAELAVIRLASESAESCSEATYLPSGRIAKASPVPKKNITPPPVKKSAPPTAPALSTPPVLEEIPSPVWEESPPPVLAEQAPALNLEQLPATPLKHKADGAANASPDDFWPELLPRLKSKLSITSYSHLATGPVPEFRDDTLTLIVGTDFSKKILLKDDAEAIVQREAEALLSRAVTVSVRVLGEQPPEAGKKDRFELLLQKKEQFKDLFDDQ